MPSFFFFVRCVVYYAYCTVNLCVLFQRPVYSSTPLRCRITFDNAAHFDRFFVLPTPLIYDAFTLPHSTFPAATLPLFNTDSNAIHLPTVCCMELFRRCRRMAAATALQACIPAAPVRYLPLVGSHTASPCAPDSTHDASYGVPQYSYCAVRDVGHLLL